MEFLAELSSSEILVTGSLALFATIILASIYIRIRGYYNRRIPNLTRRKVFWFLRKKDTLLAEPPLKNNEVITNARPVQQDATQNQEFDFGFDDALAAEASYGAESNGDVANEPQAAVFDDTLETAEGQLQADESVSTEAEVVHIQDEMPLEEAHVDVLADANGFAGETDELADTTVSSWDHAPELEAEMSDVAVVDADLHENGGFESNGEASHFESEFVETSVESETEEANGFHEEYVDNGDLGDEISGDSLFTDLNSTDQDSEAERENLAVDEVPIDRKTAEVLRVDTPAHEPQQTFVVVSVCLMSEFNNQVYRDIRGKQLASFLNSRGFILLDEEYHLQNKAMIEEGGIRIRNFEKTPIGELVKSNDETRGFRLYFRPSDSADPLQSLNEMLRIAQSAIGYFRDTCEKPLVIYDGRKPVKPLTQEGYDQLKLELIDAFPRNLASSPKRTALSRNDYAPSDDLPNRAEMN